MGENEGYPNRIGACALSLLATPLNGAILRVLAEGPLPSFELRRRTGAPPLTTLRARLRELRKLGAVDRRLEGTVPGGATHELTPVGLDLLRVSEFLQTWLALVPGEAWPLEAQAAKAATKTLVDAWETSMLWAFAAGPMSLTELDRIIPSMNYPALERRLGAMRLAGQVEAVASGGRGTPYVLTDWGRRAAAPLAAAAWWEHRHLEPASRSITNFDVETLFLLATPLLRLPPDLSGSCRLAVELTRKGGNRVVGAMVEIDGGEIASCSSDIEGYPDAWVVARAGTWLAAMIDDRGGQMEIGGCSSLARAILLGLRRTLLEPAPPAPETGVPLSARPRQPA
jgi:DNA-binding HxlR family transcriptional regulator